MKSCKQCGNAMASDAPEGLCARCLLSVAMKNQPTASIHLVESRPPEVPIAGRVAEPTIDISNLAEVARRLPQFEILELLGRGGMGVVYKARQLQLDRIVALKILPPADATAPDFVERFRREARSLAKLNHPNIVHVHDFGETNGLYYFVMEFVDGANMRSLIGSGRMTSAEALAIVPKICDALQFAHEEGVVHRDIKPENILIDKKGRVKIADFGLAKLLGRTEADPQLTVSGATLGTPRYMAPEQVDKPGSVDHRADIYSLGVVFYEMLTGELPMGRFAPPSHKVQIDVRLDEIVLHALERDVQLRYQHASEVRNDVEKVTSGSSAIAASSTDNAQATVGELPPGQPAPLRPRFQIWYFLLSTVIFTAAFCAALALWNLRWPGVPLGGVVIFIALGVATALGRNFRILLAHWKTDTPIKAVVRFGFCLTSCVGGYYFVLGGTFAQWERNYSIYHDSSGFAHEYAGKEYQLVRLLPSYQHSIPQVELTDTFGGRFIDRNSCFRDGTLDLSADDAEICFRLFLGFWLLAGAVVILFVGRGRMFKPNRSWRVWIWPATLMLAILAGWLTCGIMRVFQWRFNQSALSGSEIVKVSLNDVRQPLQALLTSRGYAPANMRIFSMNRIPDGAQIGATGAEDFVKPSPFDRWRWTRGVLVPTHPAVQLMYVTTAWRPPGNSSSSPAAVGAPQVETYVMWTIYGANLVDGSAYSFNDQLHAAAEAAKTTAPTTEP